MLLKIKAKMNKMSTKDWIQVTLWFMAFALLIAFVICASVIDKEAGTTTRHIYAATDVKLTAENFTWTTSTAGLPTGTPASTGLATGMTLGKHLALIDGTFVKDVNVTSLAIQTGAEASKSFVLANVPAYDVVKTGADYATGLAITGTLFALALIASMFTTTYFAWSKKRGGAK